MHALAFKDKLNCYLQLIFESFGKTVYIRFVCVCRKINDNMLTLKNPAVILIYPSITISMVCIIGKIKITNLNE